MNDDEVKDLLFGLGQEHLFDGWTNDEGDKEERRLFYDQVRTLNDQYPGGLEAYLKRAKALLKASAEDRNPFQGYTPKVPQAVEFAFGSDEFLAAEEKGCDQFTHSCFVLVAGGLGERLGYSGIKVALPCDLTSGMSYLELYISHIKAFQRRIGNGAMIPFAIMTSDDTHSGTLRLLEENNWFGMEENQISLMKQEKVPSLQDNQGRIARDGTYRISTKPHGHGDVHLLLHQSGLAKKWLDRGKRWILFFQDTNPLALRTLPAALGVSCERNLDVNFVGVPRKAKAAAGAIMRLCHEDGHEITINVEYNYIESLLRSTINPEQGDVNGPNGYSMFPGNVNQLVFALEPYVENLQKMGGVVSEFVNPKYADESRTVFTKPTRLECMMQDYALSLKGTDSNVGVTVFLDQHVEPLDYSLTHRLYAPTKNNLADAAKKAQAGIPDASATSSELAIYAFNSCMLKSVLPHLRLGPPKPCSFGNIDQSEWPHVAFHPSFMTLCNDLKRKFTAPDQVRISSRSTLYVQGPMVFFRKLDLDGTLVIRAAPGAKVLLQDVTIQNAGWGFEEVNPSQVQSKEEEVYAIRGFKLLKSPDACVLDFPHPGLFEITIPVPTNL